MKYFLKSLTALNKLSLQALLLMALTISSVQAGLLKKEAIEETRQYPAIPSILDIYYMAKDYDSEIAAAKYRTSAEKEVRAQAWAALFPKVQANAFTRINDNTTDSTIAFFAPESRYNENGFTFVLNQPLFNLPAFIGVPEAKLKVKKAELSLLGQEQALIARVAEAYINLIITQSNMTVVETQQKAIEELLERAKLNFDLGTATISDTREAQAARDTVHAQALAAQNSLKTVKHKLYTLTGQHLDEVVKLEVDLPLDIAKLQLPPLEKLEEIALKTNLQLNIAKIDYALSKINLRKLQSSRLPTVDLVASAGENNTNGSSFSSGTSSSKTDTEFYVIGAELNMPLFAGGAINSNVRRAKKLLRSSDELVKNVEKNTILELTEAYLNVELAQSSLKAFREAVKSAKLSLESTKLGFELGERTSLDVLSAQQTYYQAVRDHTESQYNYLISSLGINLSLGLISEKDIVLIAELINQLNTDKATN